MESLCWLALGVRLNLNHLQLDVLISIWRHNVLSAHSPEASVDFLPSPNIINNDQKLAEKAGEGGWDHYEGPHSEHLTKPVCA